MQPLAGIPTEMSRPTRDDVEDNLFRCQKVIRELSLEIHKLDQELHLMRQQVADRNALALDAHRYRWLRDNNPQGADLDAVVDARIKTEGKTS